MLEIEKSYIKKFVDASSKSLTVKITPESIEYLFWPGGFPIVFSAYSCQIESAKYK